jgi:hypothetical protein
MFSEVSIFSESLFLPIGLVYNKSGSNILCINILHNTLYFNQPMFPGSWYLNYALNDITKFRNRFLEINAKFRHTIPVEDKATMGAIAFIQSGPGI